MMEGGDLGYPNNDIAKDEIIMKLRSQNVKLRQKLKELNSALDVAPRQPVQRLHQPAGRARGSSDAW